MPRCLHRRQFVTALLAGTAGSALLAGCAGAPGPGGLASGGVATGAIGPPADPATTRREREAAAIKVGLLLPLSGGAQTALVAKALQQAAELALFERPNTGLQLIVKDDKGTPDGAKSAAEDVIKAGCELIVGPLFSKSVAAVAPVARAANVPVIGFSNDPAAAAPGVYLLSFLTDTEVDRAIDYAAGQGRKTFAALIPDDAQGRIAETAFRTSVQRRGGTIALVERYQIDTTGLIDPSRKLKEAFESANSPETPIDALFMPAGQDTLSQLASLLSQARIDTSKVKLIGTSGWDYPNAGRDARLSGGWFAAPEPRGWHDFAERFSKAYGLMPPRLASLAFDALDVAATFAGQPKGGRYTVANLTRPSGFAGSDGPYRFLSNGRNERGLAILEMQKAGPIVVEGAPSSFGGAAPQVTTAVPRAAAGLN